MIKHLCSIALVALPAFLASAASGQTPTPLTTIRVANGLSRPVYAGSPRGDDRIFVLEKQGRIRIIQGGAVLPTAFLDIQSSASNGSEQGLLGLAFHPDFASNGLFYVNYTRTNGNTRIARFNVSSNPNVADRNSEQVLIDQSQPYSNHNGGGIEFGPDGYLYVGFGDGGSGNDPSCNAQKMTTFLGKMLRIDVDGGSPYSVPATNPFVGQAGALPEIFHLGLRNPWRFSFDRLNGDLYIGDVGQDSREEISFAAAGASGVNFGWKVMEGTRCNTSSSCPGGTPACNSPTYTNPIYELTHGGFSGPCSIMGGYVYRGCAIPDLQGAYFFADYCDNKIRTFNYSAGGNVTGFLDRTNELKPAGLSIRSITAFGEDGAGEILIVDYNGGEIFQVIAASTPQGFADCDGNGKDDPCEIAGNGDLDLDQNGQLDVCQAFSADTGSLSISGGGAQSMSLHAGLSRSGDLYLVGGSLTGTSGFQVGSVVIPLTLDSYTLFSVVHANNLPLVNTLGFLDPAGAAQASFSVSASALPGSLVGMSVWHAYALVGPSGGADFASNYIELRFLP